MTIFWFFRKVQNDSTRNRRACMIRFMNVDETRGVHMSGSKQVVFCSFCLPPWEKGVNICMFVECVMF